MGIVCDNKWCHGPLPTKDLSLTVCDKDIIQTQQHMNWIEQTLLAIIMQEIYTSGFKHPLAILITTSLCNEIHYE